VLEQTKGDRRRDLLTCIVGAKDDVVVAGYVLQGSLKKDAERTVRKVEGRTRSPSPRSLLDDEIRHGV
jgi:hypothetical protein